MDVDCGTKRALEADCGDDDDARCAWCSSVIGIFRCDTVVLRGVFPFAYKMSITAEFCSVNCMFSYVCAVAVPPQRVDVRERLTALLCEYYHLTEVTRCDETTRRPYNKCVVCTAPLPCDGGPLAACSSGCKAVVCQSLAVSQVI